jgi:DmsE family decaheme c-type cytochrome
MQMIEILKKPRAGWLALLVSLCLLGAAPATAKDKDDDKDSKPAAPQVRKSSDANEAAALALRGGKFSKDGVDTCISCHDEENEYPVFPMFKTKHAVKADARTPFGHDNKQCEACHGAGNTHAKAKKTEKRAGNIINFGKNVWTPVKDQNEKCLTCHQTHQRIAWKGSSHEFSQVACASCHKVHTAKDPILSKQTQSRVCFDCHVKEQAKFQQASHHPVREGQMACTDCHDVHGEKGTGSMIKASAREKCTSCHAEKRGPFLWEHAPAAEDCNLCHTPHGSNHAALLKKRAPLLCQECHSPAGHPSGRYDGNTLAASAFLRVKGCANCHSQVHGSNHPSGATQLR